MKLYTLLITIFSSILLSSCNDEGSPAGLSFVAAFNDANIDYSSIEKDKEIKFIFSKVAENDGEIYLTLKTENANYNSDFSTMPSLENNQIIVPIKKGESSASFIFKNLIYPFDRSDKKIEFTINKINYPGGALIQGYTSLLITFDRSIGGEISPELGGPNEQYQVYVHLSKNSQKKVKRDSWDLGFYNTSNRVVLNGSIYMATKVLQETELSKVTSESVKNLLNSVRVGTFNDENKEYVDNPDGDILKTAISEIKENDQDNPVYLLNLGYEVGTMTPSVGSVAVAGKERGWKKIKFLKRGDDYLIKYGNLDDTNFQEKRIQKKSDFNFTFFSFTTNSEVSVEPEKLKWDLNFTVFTNLITGNGSYGFTDFVVNNLKAGVKAYRVEVKGDINYDSFNASNIDESKFANDQRTIGDSWRKVIQPQVVYNDRFYVLKDASNNYYKIKMIALVNSSGVRGYPRFEYKLIK